MSDKPRGTWGGKRPGAGRPKGSRTKRKTPAAPSPPTSPAATPAKVYDSPQEYLEAVVRGHEPPDPVRVGAARALLPFVAAPRRARAASDLAPRHMRHRDEQVEVNEARRAWRERAEEVRRRHRRKEDPSAPS